MRKSKFLNKILSILLIISILLPIIPIGEIKAWAQSGIEINEMEINYTYKERDESQLDTISFYIVARFYTKGNYNIKARDSKGIEHNIGRINIDDNNVGSIVFPSFEMKPRDNIRITTLYIGGQPIRIEDPTPKITKMQTYDVLLGDNLKFEGENLNEGTMNIEGIGTIFPQNPTEFSYTIGIDAGNPGYKTINFKVEGNHNLGGRIIQNITYPNIFKLMGTLKELGDQPGDYLEIIPETGEKESVAYIRANNGQFNVKDGIGEYSVFFLKDTTDKYSQDNMAEIISFSQNRKVMKIKVPKEIQDSLPYEVQVTNKVKNPRGNIDEQVLERRTVRNSYFVIGADKSPVLTSIEPEKGPDTGEIVQITGKKFDEVDFINGLENIGNVKVKEDEATTTDKPLDNVLVDIIGSEGFETDGREDKVIHFTYEVEGATYKKEPVISIDRYIAAYVGDRTEPHTIDHKPVFLLDDVFDSISFKVPKNDVDKPTEVNVILVMQTEIITSSGTHTIVNVLSNDEVKYTILPSHTKPTINRVIPDKIQVVKSGTDYRLKEDMIIAIEGENFKVIRTKDTTNYPIIGLGADLANSEAGIVLRVSPENEGQIDIRKGNTWTPLPGANITIIDNKGNIIDGTLGKDVGNKIIISLPRSESIKILDTVVTTNPRNPKPKPVYVRNPVLGSQSPGEAVSNDRVTITFVDLQDNPSPTIDRISPNVVAIDSGEEVTVTGSNFQTGIRVFVGGVEVTGVKHELDPSGLNTILKFNAPKFPQIVEGPTKLTVMNLDGGQASKDFTYVKSLQRDPNLMDFSPKSGTMGTVVIVDGDNFLAPNPAVSNITGMGIYRLIGSRILMDGKDINEYIIDNNGNISLEKYTNPLEHLVYEKDNVAKLADYGHSIVLVEKNNQNSYYTIYYDNRFNIILSDGGIGTEENNIINQYIISYKDGELIGEKDGQIYEVETSEEGIILKQNNITALDLIMKTPYKFHHETKEIYGSKVHVIDKNRIEFTVPNLTSKLPGGYKITVENPDTKKSTAKDLFYYYETVSLKPEIIDIKPSIGSIEGGYQILIEGNNFEDDSKVYIDGILVPANDVKREIRSGQDTLIITKMPPYRRNMPEEETDRKVVPVVVENGNGGTALGRFTYVIPPSARPIVDKVEFQKETQIGSAAGDEVLTITGRYFKFEEPWSTVPKYRGWKQGKRKDGTTIYYEDLDKDDKHTSYESWIDYREQEKDNEERIKPLPNTIETYKEYLDSPVLPTIRIGGIEAKIVEFGTNYIKVITPQITPGRHELYVVNNDFGTSNRVMINFQGSKITIDKIVGDTGKKQGKDAVEILGSGFQNTNIRTLENGNIRQYNMPKVRFGTIGGTKDINNNRAQITLEGGDFTIEYDYSNTKTAMITMTAKYNKEIYKKVFTMENYDGEPIYLPTWELRNLDGVPYPGYELVKIETKNRKLIVEKGYSPETELINPGQIALKTPSYYTVGDVQVEVTNPDGGRGTTRYRYTNPASKPRITNITRDGMDPSLGDDGKTRILRLDYRGGQNIVVLGEDFREGARIQIGNVLNIENKDIVETLNATPNKLAFIMPQVNENAVGKLYRVTVINGDGAQASSDNPNNIWNAPIYIQFIKGESDPELGSIVPDKGPATGGTKVTIKGKDFREKMEGYEGEDLKIFFGGTQVPKKDIRIIDHNTIEVVAPESSTLGQVRVKIENPDGSLTQQNLIFTYISKPKIDDVNPKKIFINDTKTEVTIKGRQFLPGAKVIVGGKIIPIKDLKSDMDLKGQGITGVDAQGNNREVAVIGGMEAASVNLVDGELKVRFNQATDLENSSLIIINPDGGISDPYDDFKYEKPLPLKPMVLEGIPGYESTVMLIWNESDPDLLNRATKYEIYGRLAKDNTSTYIGNTTDAQYLIKGLEPDTEYIFMVRALNEYGAAIDFAEVKVRTLSLLEDEKQREKEEELKEEEKKLLEKGKEEIIGNKIIKTLGAEDIKYGIGNLDFNQSKYKNTTELLINIPIALARTDSTLNIKYGELQMSINPKDLYTYRVSALDKGDKDSNLQINIKRQGESHIPRGKKIASRAYEFHFGFQVGRNTIDIDQILRSGKLTLNLDNILYSNAKNVELYKYDNGKGEYIKTSNNRTTSFNKGGKYILLSNR